MTFPMLRFLLYRGNGLRRVKSLLFAALLVLPLWLSAQNGTIKGTVTDDGSGEPLIGVNIVYAAGKGTVSDIEGAYELDLPFVHMTLPFHMSAMSARLKLS